MPLFSKNYFFSCFSFYLQFTAGWVPKGFVSTITSPGFPKFGRVYSLCWHMTFATPPIIGHGFMILCPPVMLVPASFAQSSNPLIISLALCYPVVRKFFNICLHPGS